MEVEDSSQLLFKDWTPENSAIILPEVQKCITESRNEREILRALEIAFNYCLEHLSIAEIEGELFRNACLTSKKIIEDRLRNLIKDLTTCVEGLNISIQIMSFFERVFQIFNEKKIVRIAEVKNFLIISLELVHCCLTHCKRSEEVYGSLFGLLAEHLSSFFKKCCDLLEHILSFLTADTKCDFKNENEMCLSDKAMSFLSKSGIVLINLEIKTMAKVWKAFVFIIENHLCLKNYKINETIKDLCCNITTNMDAVEDNQFEKIIKLNCFLLKLIMKFCNVFAGVLNQCHNSLLNLLLMLCRWDVLIKTQSKFKTKERQDLLNQLMIGAEPLLSLLMRDELFVNEIHYSHISKNSVEFPVLCCLIMKNLVNCDSAVRSLWFNDKKNVLMWVFYSASSSEFMFTNVSLPSIVINGVKTKFTDLYEYVLVTTSAFLMTVREDEYRFVEMILIQNVVQTNPVKALLAVDIWCILARFAGSELCLSQILTLGKILQEVKTLRTEKWYLMSLIRRLFCVLSQSHKELFLKSFHTSFYSTLWEVCGFGGLTSIESSCVRKCVLAEIDHVLDDNETTSRNYKNEKLESRISKMWKFNCELLASNAETEKFLKILCNLTASIVSDLSSEDLFLVLTQMKKLLTIGQPTCIQLYFTQILKSLSTVSIPPGNLQKKTITTISQIFQILLSSQQILVKQKSFETFYTFSHITLHEEVISLSVQDSSELRLEVMKYFKKSTSDLTDFNLTDYYSELCNVGVEHVCLEVGLAQKKVADQNKIVMRWKEDGKRIVECFQLLSESEKREIKNVCQSILDLSDN